MARDATARLYDVDEDSLVFTKLRQSQKYDVGTIVFRAKPGRWVDLDKLHESIWATRLSGGTSSGVISLEVTVVGEVVVGETETTIKASGTDRELVLVPEIAAWPSGGKTSVLDALRDVLAGGGRIANVTGYVEGWSGRWPQVLRQTPPRRPHLMVTAFEVSGDQNR